ncbi:MAG: DUF924 family protein [Pseudomonadota bacterium]
MKRVLAFWFGENGDPDWGAMREAWFEKSDDFDRACRDGFLDLHEQAASDKLDDWMASADGTLALLILLDQLPRNMFRGSARMYATDNKALAIAEHAVANGLDAEMTDVQKLFAHLPFEHAEDLDHQKRHVAYIDANYHGPKRKECQEAAARHLEIIDRFGRFPHRNEILGRVSTDEEIEFLKEPNSSF